MKEPGEGSRLGVYTGIEKDTSEGRHGSKGAESHNGKESFSGIL